MIKLQVLGHLGKDATTNTVNSKNVINFNVCHTEKWKDAQGNQKEKSTWVECSWWTESVGVAQYMKKGGMVLVEGNPEVKIYPKNDGTQGVSLTLRVLSMQLAGASGGGNNNTDTHEEQAPQTKAAATKLPNSAPKYDPAAPVDDLPF